MKATILLTALLLFLSGCASFPGLEGALQRSPQSKSLARAQELLESGDRSGAVRELTAVTDARGVPGVTDEALFRLALLTVHPAADTNGNLSALNLLKRLKREYPASRWTVQSGQLLELLAGAEELQRQVKSLKSQNQSLKSQNQALGSEINELNRNINQLKQLDQELEKRRR